MRVREGELHRCRRDCEERRRYLAELSLLGERLRGDARQLLGEMAPAGEADGAAVPEPLRGRHDKLQRSIAEIAVQIAAAADALALAEEELGRRELAWAQRFGKGGLPG